MEIIYHGHSTVQITNRDGVSLIIDPFFTGNPVAKAAADDIKVSYILLTHGHGDHFGDTIQIAKNNNATVVATHELATYCSWQGVNAHSMNLGGSKAFEFGRAQLTQAFHSSSLDFGDDQKIVYLGMPAGIVMKIDGKTIYHAGDTGLFGDMKLIGELNDIDLAFLPIGDNFTMGPDEAVIAAEWVKAKKVVPVHYNTFDLIKQDSQAFAQKLAAKGIEGIALEPGQKTEL